MLPSLTDLSARVKSPRAELQPRLLRLVVCLLRLTTAGWPPATRAWAQALADVLLLGSGRFAYATLEAARQLDALLGLR
jgi:hypothetical protein